MDPAIKDWLQAAAWLATAAGLIVAAAKLWSELVAGRVQRERELRWRQAKAGKSLNDEMQTDDRAWPAMQMLDSDSRAYEVRDGVWVTITHDDVARALDPVIDSADEKITFIRDCFDALFYFLAMLDHYISSTLILADDVTIPIEYYVPLMAELRPQITAYLNRYEPRARPFLERYAVWRDACATTGAAPSIPA